MSEQRTLYLNQFTGQTITNATAAQDSALSRATSLGISMQMGNPQQRAKVRLHREGI